jgi:hypothetical protein
VQPPSCATIAPPATGTSAGCGMKESDIAGDHAPIAGLAERAGEKHMIP